MSPVLVITTCSRSQADRLKKIVIEKKLGVCVSSFRVSSLY